MGVNSQMISDLKDTVLVSLLMIASLSYVESAIAGPYSGALYQGENFVGTYAAGTGDCKAVLQHPTGLDAKPSRPLLGCLWDSVRRHLRRRAGEWGVYVRRLCESSRVA